MTHPHVWRRRRTLIVLASAWTGTGIAAPRPSVPAAASAPDPGARPSDWATPQPELGVPNLHHEQVVKALRALRAARASGPVLLHCQHGADRTGVISAVLRMTEQGWSRQQAMDEMFRGGYGYHTLWRNIPAYLQHVDARALQTRVAAAEPGR